MLRVYEINEIEGEVAGEIEVTFTSPVIIVNLC